MSDITSQFSFSDAPRSGFRRVLASIARGMSRYADANARRKQIEALESMTDEQLAQLGLTRDRIVRHVFRDQLYL
ncbi:DUF1127 domain-containing protein [Alisedimentitalea sp. MJ-SS2]|uniref:DUF1127 domain-containing protein n=1 Tax=Aliisedimentitalea sp. MJ-SS2 TaxID=3049795 RepID=UPI00290FAA09|nr:DUF1127 domain-containing protein [Alisedimentitalea sp. MJ-SS2]MDU8926058.1 DUF1127 domain-containing protein [Alisedimentitalea sp. MJ-SS2]